MREILFRVWNGSNYEYDVMVGKFGAFYVNPMNSGIDATDSASLSPYNTKFGDDVVIEQFTGVSDSKGTKIFDGDILRANTGRRWEDGTIIHYPQYVQVIYNTKKARFEILGKLGDSHKALNEVFERCRAVVVGNIHNNPELLT